MFFAHRYISFDYYLLTDGMDAPGSRKNLLPLFFPVGKTRLLPGASEPASQSRGWSHNDAVRLVGVVLGTK